MANNLRAAACLTATILSAALGGGFASTAQAADLPVKAAPVGERMCDPGRFAGFYAGVNGGYVHHEALRLDADGLLGEASSKTASRGGGEAGGQIGYNWQRHCTVFGLEGDLQWFGATASGQMFPNTPLTLLTFSSEPRWLGTVRGRAGFVIDSTLVYVTGGAAFASVRDTWTAIDPLAAVLGPGGAGAAPIFFTTSFTNTRVGAVIGVGAEFAWTENISIKGEALYVAFPDQSTTFPVPPALALNPLNLATIKGSDNALIARVGVNWRFGGPVF